MASWQAGKLEIGLGDQNIAFSVTAEADPRPNPSEIGRRRVEACFGPFEPQLKTTKQEPYS